MIKLTKKQVEDLKNDFKNEVTVTQLALKYNISKGLVCYHTNEDFNKRAKERSIKSFKNKSPEQKKQLYLSRKDYIKNYMRTRYNSDPKFRESILQRSRAYSKMVYDKKRSKKNEKVIS